MFDTLSDSVDKMKKNICKLITNHLYKWDTKALKRFGKGEFLFFKTDNII